MTPAQELALIVTLAVLLAVVSATAGALWWRVRSIPLVRAARLARDLAERQRALEDVLGRLEKAGARRGASAVATPHPSGPPPVRLDPPEAPATRPPLIAVPDLAAPAAGPSAASHELARRFGAIWDLADSGTPADAIALATGQPIGQVELILGLRRRLATTGGKP